MSTLVNGTILQTEYPVHVVLDREEQQPTCLHLPFNLSPQSLLECLRQLMPLSPPIPVRHSCMQGGLTLLPVHLSHT